MRPWVLAVVGVGLLWLGVIVQECVREWHEFRRYEKELEKWRNARSK